LVDRLLGGEDVTLTRSGRPVVVLVRPDMPLSRRAADILDPSAILDHALSQGEESDLSDLRSHG